MNTGRNHAIRRIAIAILGLALMANYAGATNPDNPSDMHQGNQWLKEHLLNDNAELPFSFAYDRQGSSALLKTWPKKIETKQLDGVRTEHIVSWTDPKTGLQVRLSALEFASSPVVEWTAYFKNDSKVDAPISSTSRRLTRHSRSRVKASRRFFTPRDVV